MERYAVYEGHMDALRKKVAAIQKKCDRFGCDFHFAEVGEETRDIVDPSTINPITGKPVKRPCRFVIVEAEGTAIVSGWQFVASVEHTEKGNVFSKALLDVEIPERYRNSTPYCEHCNSHRTRKNTFIVQNTATGEFKQVGHSCLNDFTHGMSVSFAAYLASVRDVFKEAEDEGINFGGMGWWERRLKTEEILKYTAETIRHFGYSKSEKNGGDSTRGRVQDIFNVCNGNTRFMVPDEVSRISNLIRETGFDPDSAEAERMVKDALTWLDGQEASNDYMHNLKTVTALETTTYSRFGLLVSLFPTYDRELAKEAARRAEMEQGKASEYVGSEGDSVMVDIASVKCLTSWESCYDGYHMTETYIWKLVGKDGNIYTWKTSKWLDADRPPVSIKGKVKGHKEYRGVKQTELTRCRVG